MHIADVGAFAQVFAAIFTVPARYVAVLWINNRMIAHGDELTRESGSILVCTKTQRAFDAHAACALISAYVRASGASCTSDITSHDEIEQSSAQSPTLFERADSFYVWGSIHPCVSPVAFLVDTGANLSLFPENGYLAIPAGERPSLQPSNITVDCGNNSQLVIIGVLYLDVTIDDVTYCGVFHVSSEEPRAVLGMDFLERYNAQVTVGRSRLTLDKRRVDIYNVDGVRLNHHSHRHQPNNVCGEARQELQSRTVHVGCGVLSIIPTLQRHFFLHDYCTKSR